MTNKPHAQTLEQLAESANWGAAKMDALRAGAAALRAPQGETCDWRDGDCWEASCGLKWGMDNDGTPAENQMAYCPKCGKRLNVLPPVSPATEQE